jgi:hypothetical protein
VTDGNDSLGQERDPLSSHFHRALRGERLLAVSFVDFRNVLEDTGRLLILGEAGAGKSALLAHLCWSRLRRPHPRVPLFLSSRHLAAACLTEHVTRLADDLALGEL